MIATTQTFTYTIISFHKQRHKPYHNMAMVLEYSTDSHTLRNEDTADVFVPEITKEDMEKAREIGVLTPRSVLPCDKIAQAPAIPTWLQIAVLGCSPKVKSVADDIEFLLMVAEQEGDAHEDILDEIDDMWQHDLDGQTRVDIWPMPYPPAMPKTTTKIVRITSKPYFAKFCFGTMTDGPADVFIPEHVITNTCNLHDFYLMDLEYHPQGKNLWRVTKIHPKLDTSAMLISYSQVSCGFNQGQMLLGESYVYDIPCDHESIGVIIGKNGKNILNLKEKIYDDTWETDLPEVDITPFGIGMARVTVTLGPQCLWVHNHVTDFVSRMHA